jgi:hypothetical protein
LPPGEVAEDDPREQLRVVIDYLESNCQRMHYDEYRRQGLPTTSAWMESAVKEMNYRVKGSIAQRQLHLASYFQDSR